MQVDAFLKYRGREELSDRSGNSGYHSLGDTVAAVLQEMNSVGHQRTAMPHIIQRYLLHVIWSFFGETNVLFETLHLRKLT